MCTCAGCMFGHVFLWRSQYHGSLISFWVFLYMYTYLGGNSIQVTNFEISAILKGENIVNDIFPAKVFNVDITAKKGLAGNI